MRMRDFQCKCGVMLEELVDNEVRTWTCPTCGSAMEQVWIAPPKIFSTVVPTYPGCKAQKAGYMHTHGDRPATRTQSGYGGSQSGS